MTEPRVELFLNIDTQMRLASGRHGMLLRVVNVLESSGWRIIFRENSAAQRAASAMRPGYALFHMEDPTHDRALTLRRVYHYPFWQIERSARRWEWQVATTGFPGASAPRPEVDRFYRNWQQRLFGDAPFRARREGIVYVPLQGRLLERRSFQSCAPIDMVHRVIAVEPDRKIALRLHPRETYASDEIAALEDLARRDSRISLGVGGMEEMLEVCDCVVTQNSSAAFSGYFFGKPAVLFGQVDFHHIAEKPVGNCPAEALSRAREAAPDYAAYVHWFWQVMSINAGRAEADDRIRAALRRGGWPI